MSTPTVPVTVTLAAQDGTPYVGVTVRARLDGNEVYEGVVVADEAEAVTDASGEAVLNCFPNAPSPTGLGTQGSTYRFWAHIPGARTVNYQARVPNTACRLENILVTEDIGSLSAAELALLQAQSAVTTAASSAAAAADDATQTAADREQTGLDRTATGDDRTAVETARDAALTAQAAAQASETAAASSEAAAASSAEAAASSEASAAAIVLGGQTPPTYLSSYDALRAYSGAAKAIHITGYLATSAPSGIAGLFTRDDSDTTSADNGGTIIVASDGKRWKRVFDGPVNAGWFGAKGDGATDDTAALVSFLAASENRKGFIPAGVYKITSVLTLAPTCSYNIEGETYDPDGAGGTVIYNAGTGRAVSLENLPFTQNYDNQIRLANLTIKGNPLSSDGVYASQCMIFLENVWLTGHGGNGMHMVRAYSSSFRQVVFANNAQNGLSINRAANAVHFDHCIFNGNGSADGYAGCYVSGGTDGYNYGVVFTACDFTGNGTGPTTVGYGIVVQYGRGVSLIGCYGEANKSRNLYADSTTNNLAVLGSYWQDADVEIVGVDGLVYKNNHHQQISASADLIVSGGLPTSRIEQEVFGNTYTGGAAPVFSGGVSETRVFRYGSAPTAGTWKNGDIVLNTNGAGGGAPGWMYDGGAWLPLARIPQTYANHGDADATLTAFSSFPTNLWQSPLTADRAVTLSTIGAASGVSFRISRSPASTGAFNLNVGTGPLKALATGQWCDVEYDGAAWRVTAAGSL